MAKGNITIKVFQAFQETESLFVRWDSHTESITQNTPHFKTFQHYTTATIKMDFHSTYQGTDMDRVFWLEYYTGKIRLIEAISKGLSSTEKRGKSEK
jgi:hypothetical protein